MRGFMKNRAGKGRCHLLGEWGTVPVRPEGGTGLDFLAAAPFVGPGLLGKSEWLAGVKSEPK